MHVQDVVIVIPVYQDRLDWYEQISLARCFEVLGHDPIVFLAPEGRPLDFGAAYRDVPRVTFPARYFTDVMGYNALLLSPAFYERFRAYRKILIYQLDAFVFSDELMAFVAMDYDWIGAPWPLEIRMRSAGRGGARLLPCGNGGFSLRDTRACQRLLARQPSDGLIEDTYFSYFFTVDPAFRIAPVTVARRFSSEYDAERVWQKNGYVLPFGCHAWQKYSADFYVWAFAQVGYDMRQARQRMYDLDMIHIEEMRRHRAERYAPVKRSDITLAAAADWLRAALAAKDVDEAANAIFYAEPRLRPDPHALRPDEVYMAGAIDALLSHGIKAIEVEERPGHGIRYLKAWQRLAYKYYQRQEPEVFRYLAEAYQKKGMARMAAHYEALGDGRS